MSWEITLKAFEKEQYKEMASLMGLAGKEFKLSEYRDKKLNVDSTPKENVKIMDTFIKDLREARKENRKTEKVSDDTFVLFINKAKKLRGKFSKRVSE